VFQWIIALADTGMSTPEVYAALDEHRLRHAADIPPIGTPVVEADVLTALRAGDPHMLAEALHNDLQAPALHLRPELADVLELGERNGALAGVVSGSGPSIAFLTADLDSALSLQIALSAARLTVLRVTGPAHGARLTS
jgi:4-diphosphocytidyl-2-C-methyl-D-erythritol kinase